MFYEYSSTSYCYCNENDADDVDDVDVSTIEISIVNYLVVNPDGIEIIISNYYIYDEDIYAFATIVWEDIEYKNDNYDPYDYDPDPKMLVYRDDLNEETTNKYITLIDKLSNTFYKPTTNYKHFNPKLQKIPLSQFNDDKYKFIKDEFINIINNIGVELK
jgi:hypothetical protein